MKMYIHVLSLPASSLKVELFDSDGVHVKTLRILKITDKNAYAKNELNNKNKYSKEIQSPVTKFGITG